MRDVDVEPVMALLAEHGIEAREGEGLAIDVPCEDGLDRSACEELIETLERIVADAGLPLVPVLGDDRVYLRPPGD